MQSAALVEKLPMKNVFEMLQSRILIKKNSGDGAGSQTFKLACPTPRSRLNCQRQLFLKRGSNFTFAVSCAKYVTMIYSAYLPGPSAIHPQCEPGPESWV